MQKKNKKNKKKEKIDLLSPHKNLVQICARWYWNVGTIPYWTDPVFLPLSGGPKYRQA
jgi:hypothetical protein